MSFESILNAGLAAVMAGVGALAWSLRGAVLVGHETTKVLAKQDRHGERITDCEERLDALPQCYVAKDGAEIATILQWQRHTDKQIEEIWKHINRLHDRR